MTLDELAIKSGVSKRMISAYEAKQNDITFKKLQNIAIALNVGIIDLISDEDFVFSEKDASEKLFSTLNTKDSEGIEYGDKELIEILKSERKNLLHSLQQKEGVIGKLIEMMDGIMDEDIEKLEKGLEEKGGQ